MKIKLNNLMFDRLIEAQEWMHDNDCAHTYATIQENNIPPGLLSQPDWATVRECSTETTVCAGEFNDLVRFIEAVELIKGVVDDG